MERRVNRSLSHALSKRPCEDSEWHHLRASEEVEQCPGQEKAQWELAFDRLVLSESILQKA